MTQNDSYRQFVDYLLCPGTTLRLWQPSGKVPNFKQLQNIMRSGLMIDGKLSFNILTETLS